LRSDLLVSVEENSVKGGFGSAVAQCVNEAGITTPLRLIGIPDEFVEHAPRGDLLRDLGLSAEGIAAAVKRAHGRSAKRARNVRAPSGRK
jgi:1-deoxy-D-xylulose-5-phosphate synthase